MVLRPAAKVIVEGQSKITEIEMVIGNIKMFEGLAQPRVCVCFAKFERRFAVENNKLATKRPKTHNNVCLIGFPRRFALIILVQI